MHAVHYGRLSQEGAFRAGLSPVGPSSRSGPPIPENAEQIGNVVPPIRSPGCSPDPGSSTRIDANILKQNKKWRRTYRPVTGRDRVATRKLALAFLVMISGASPVLGQLPPIPR